MSLSGAAGTQASTLTPHSSTPKVPKLKRNKHVYNAENRTYE